MHWDVRTTGADTNGGGFDSRVASPGTDFSQQDGAQVTYVDLVIGGTTTQLTSVLHPFGSTFPGNVINITGGTGCTTGWYEINSVTSTTATMDRSVGTAASVCTGNLGGGFLTFAQATTVWVGGNTIDLKNGTYTFTTRFDFGSDSSGFGWTIRGYNATHSDDGAPPTITTSTNSIHMFGSTTGPRIFLDNLILTNTAGTPGDGFRPNSQVKLQSRKTSWSGFAWALNGVDTNIFFELLLFQVEVKSSKTGGIKNEAGGALRYCYIHDNTGDGVLSASEVNAGNGTMWSLDHSIIVRNTSIGFESTNSSAAITIHAINSIVAFNGSDGIKVLSGAMCATCSLNVLVNNVIYGNTGLGINFPVTQVLLLDNQNNSYGSNTGGNHTNLPNGTGDVTLTANPFTDGTGTSGHDNWTLNSTAGGGAALKAVGFPGTFAAGTTTTTGSLDIGVVQSTCAAPATTSGYTFAALLRRECAR